LNILKKIITWLSVEKIFTIFVIPIILSILVSLQMQIYFNQQELKKNITIKISSLEDEIFKYNELFINNFPLMFINNLQKNIIVNDINLKFSRENLQQIIHNEKQKDYPNIALSKYILQYTMKNLTDPHIAYLKVSTKIGLFKEKYKHLQSKLKIIKEKVRILNNDLQCENNNTILNKLIQKFTKREKFHNKTMSHILKKYNEFKIKYQGKYIDIYKYNELINNLTPTYIYDNNFKGENLNVDNLLIDFNKINSKYISNYNTGLIEIDEYCK